MNEGSVAYINTLLQYYNITPDPDSLSDEEWTLKYVILEDIRQKEKERTANELTRHNISH
ncbi:MAG: hypothetical protein N4A74_21435 [Carboxylicivirga sp.]|nr:hypothetical protein [Carboxylicivirga sp.]